MKNLSKKEWIAVAVGIVFMVYIMFGDTVSTSFKQAVNQSDMAAVETNNLNNMSNGGMVNPAVNIEEIIIGTGTELKTGMLVGVNYVLKLLDGTVLQDSKLVNANAPFQFTYGAGEVIPGWEMGILGMRVGGKRVITIPSGLGYGAKQVGPIPANSTLVFEIEVVSAQ